MDVYCEQNLVNPNIDKHNKKNRVLGIVRYVLLVIGVILISLVLMMGCSTSVVDGNFKPIIVQMIFGLVFCVPFILSFFFIEKYINNSNLEFDYLISDGNFRIVKVVNRKKRKKFVEFNMSSVESIGRIQTENYDRYAAAKDTKKLFALGSYDNEENIIYLYYGQDGNRTLLHIEPNDEMLMALRRSVSRISIIDKSVNLPVNKDEKNSSDNPKTSSK